MRLDDKIPSPHEIQNLVQSSVESSLEQALLEQERPLHWVVAVSGGIDSMVLLHSVARLSPSRLSLTVATFDHGTGTAATAAAELVSQTAQQLGIACVVGKAERIGRTEAEWREARWAFLRSVMKSSKHDHHTSVVTAHTRSDQIETVFMRALREAGPRGLAALYAASDVIRPLLALPRSVIEQYATANNITYISDPSNFNTRHLRNRVRHHLLPKIRAVRPTFDDELLSLAKRAADWRAQMDRIAANFTVMIDGTNSVYVPRTQLLGYSEDALRALWPSLVARAGIVMDWRGTHRLATFTIEGDPGQSIQLSGGIQVRLRRDAFIFTRTRPHASRA